MAKVPTWMYRQSAVVPYRQGAGGVEVLLVTSRKGKRWVLPKGVVDPGLSPAESAAKEAEEEAGVRGPVDPRALGSYRYRKWGGVCTVEVFAMAVEEEATAWPEAGFRRRRWLPADQARSLLDEPELRSLLAGFIADAIPQNGS